MKLDNDIFVYEWTNPMENNCNSYFIGGTVRALIDPGLTAFLPDLLGKMEKDGIDTDAIQYVISTHSHPDHFEGSQTFSGRDGVRIGLHSEGITFLNGMGGRMYGLFGLDAPQVDIDMPLEEGPVTLGGEDFEILHTPGHSPGSISLYWPAQKALFPGDVIFDQNIGRTDFPGGSEPLLKESILKLARLEVEYFLPGHMGIIIGSEQVQRNFEFVINRIFPYI